MVFRADLHAQGSYADANGTPNAAYFSVRRFPYSRDRTKNDLSFRHIADENPLPTTTPGRLNGVAGASSSTMLGDSHIVGSYQAPSTSLDDADAQVCIKNDTP
jgi:hypothetical protein